FENLSTEKKVLLAILLFLLLAAVALLIWYFFFQGEEDTTVDESEQSMFKTFKEIGKSKGIAGLVKTTAVKAKEMVAAKTASSTEL
ncbi:unnamed protein product, partial [Heterosigma akashiwo]